MKIFGLKIVKLLSLIGLFVLTFIATISSAEVVLTQEQVKQFYAVVVNSSKDNIIADGELTLREAIAVTNNTLPLSSLSPAEQAQIQPNPTASIIRFNLPKHDYNTIRLQQKLPGLISPGLTVDGNDSVIITAIQNKTIQRGLTVLADDITIKNLNIYGFHQPKNKTGNLPTGNIIVGYGEKKTEQIIPQRVTIANNQLGSATFDSSFGVWIWCGYDTQIINNRITNHNGSGIVSSEIATNTLIKNNEITSNGKKGMPHAIRLAGNIGKTTIVDNTITDNDGSGIYLFKPQGAVTISSNKIINNSQRIASAAVYLIGNNHVIDGNYITNQNGSGVVASAYEDGRGNFITNNQFYNIRDLSIDLITSNHIDAPYYLSGDGINPVNNSFYRHFNQGNAKVSAPKFLSDEFYLIDGKVTIDGIANPNNTVTIYQVVEDSESDYGPLNQVIGEVKSDDKGKFSLSINRLKAGNKISAIATDSTYGTSESAANAVISNLSAKTNSYF